MNSQTDKTSRLRGFRRWALIGCASLLVTFTAISWLIGGKLVRPANRIVGQPPVGLPAIVKDTIPSGSGSNLAAWYLEHPAASGTVVLLHPIRADRRVMLSRAALLYDAGYSSLLVDLQAHGESPGEAITFGHLERHDVVAAVEYVRVREPSHKIAVIGWSLGGAAALLGSPLSIDALVIESVYPTIDEATGNRVSARIGAVGKVVTPVLLAQLGPRLQVDRADLRPIDCISEVGCPVLVMAGDGDRHTTLAETQRLFAAAHEPKQLQVFQGAVHQDLLRYDSQLYEDSVVGFLDEWMRKAMSSNSAP